MDLKGMVLCWLRTDTVSLFSALRRCVFHFLSIICQRRLISHLEFEKVVLTIFVLLHSLCYCELVFMVMSQNIRFSCLALILHFQSRLSVRPTTDKEIANLPKVHQFASI